jgi:catechol 2,3-dioxygenase-like lactoylglutathione lyase family enzyme
MTELDHIALYVTNIERSKVFYRDVLHMSVSETISLREQSTGLKYGHSLLTHGPSVVKNLINRANPTAIQQMFTNICYCSTSDGSVNLILVEQTHPEKGYVRSVSGNSLYGFSCYLSRDIDTDDLGWDLQIADISFEHGDSGTDGTVYTPHGDAHSIFVRDPDDRMIELISSEEGGEGKFLTGLGYAVFYVDNIQASSTYYQEYLGLVDITPSHIPKDPWKKTIVWLGTPGEKPVILLYKVTRPDGTSIPAGGYGVDHIALSGIIPLKSEKFEPCCVTEHPPEKNRNPGAFLRAPHDYLIEIIKS